MTVGVGVGWWKWWFDCVGCGLVGCHLIHTCMIAILILLGEAVGLARQRLLWVLIVCRFLTVS